MNEKDKETSTDTKLSEDEAKQAKQLEDEIVKTVEETIASEVTEAVEAKVQAELEKRLNETPDPRFNPPTEPKVTVKKEPFAIEKALELGMPEGQLERNFQINWSPQVKGLPENGFSPDSKALLYLYGKCFERQFETRNPLDEEYQKAKAAIYATVKAATSPTSPRYQKLLSEGANPGALTVFTQLIPELIRLRDESTYSNLWRTFVVSQNTGTIPIETAISRPYFTGEGTIKPQDDPTATKVSWELQVAANITIVTRQLIADSVIDWGRYIVEENLRGFDLFKWEMLATGAGGVEPVGYDTQVFTNTNAAAHPLTYANLVTAYHALGSPYRPEAVWLMNDNAFELIDGLLDTTNRPVFDNQQAELQTIKGRPVILNSYISGDASTSPNATTIYFTNPRYWAWFTKGEMEVDFNDRPVYSAGGTNTGTLKSGWERNEVGWRFEQRFDGQFLRETATSELTNVY